MRKKQTIKKSTLGAIVFPIVFALVMAFMILGGELHVAKTEIKCLKDACKALQADLAQAEADRDMWHKDRRFVAECYFQQLDKVEQLEGDAKGFRLKIAAQNRQIQRLRRLLKGFTDMLELEGGVKPGTIRKWLEDEK